MNPLQYIPSDGHQSTQRRGNQCPRYGNEMTASIISSMRLEDFDLECQYQYQVWMEITVDIAVTHPQGADVWECGRHSSDNKPRQDSKAATRFFRNAQEDLSKTLVEAVSELLKEHTE